MNSTRKVFVSHSVSDYAIAKSIGKLIETTFSNVTCFVSTREGDIPSGEKWFSDIHNHIEESQVAVAVMTPISVTRPWIIHEFGYSLGRQSIMVDRAVIPIAIGWDRKNLPSPLNGFQCRRFDSERDVEAFLNELENRLNRCAIKGSKAVSLCFKSIQDELERLSSVNVVDFATSGISGIFSGRLKNHPNTLRAMTTAKKRIVIAGPSLSTPLRSSNKVLGLKVPILNAVTRRVNVYLFIINPLQRFGENAARTVKSIRDKFGGSNTLVALNALRDIYQSISSANRARLRVFIVNKPTLDFAVLCDQDKLLCRSTIHWPPDPKGQGGLNRCKEHDYKPPILEAVRVDDEESFYSEYRNYLENLLYSADVESETPEDGPLVKELFPVLEVSSVLRK